MSEEMRLLEALTDALGFDIEKTVWGIKCGGICDPSIKKPMSEVEDTTGWDYYKTEYKVVPKNEN